MRPFYWGDNMLYKYRGIIWLVMCLALFTVPLWLLRFGGPKFPWGHFFAYELEILMIYTLCKPSRGNP